MAKKTQYTSARSKALTKDLVINAAIRLADADGLDGLSMRKLGRELGVEAMALYHHFADKSHLIDSMIDRIHAEITVPQGDLDWRDFMQSRAESVFEVLLLHPWAAPIMEASVNPGPSTLQDSDNCIRSFRQAGFSIEMTVHAVTVLNIYIYGAAALYARLAFATPDEAADFSQSIQGQFPTETYPYLGEILTQYMMKSSYDPKAEFEFGLKLVLDGLEQFDPNK